MKRAIEHDSHDGIKRVWGEFLCARDEIAGSVVNERVDFAKLLLRLRHGGFDRGIVANVAGRESGGAAKPANLFACLAEWFLVPADQEHSRTQLGEPQSHGTSESGAPAGDEDRPALE